MHIPMLIKILFYEESRKVCFGVWLKIVATWLLFIKLIDVQTWMFCIMSSVTLVGGGTLMDKYMEGKKNGNSLPENPKA